MRAGGAHAGARCAHGGPGGTGVGSVAWRGSRVGGQLRPLRREPCRVDVADHRVRGVMASVIGESRRDERRSGEAQGQGPQRAGWETHKALLAA